MRQEERLREEGQRLVDQTRSPTEAYAATLERLNGLLQAGAIDQATYDRALTGAAGELAEAQNRLLRQSRAWQDGVRRGVQDYAKEATDAAQAAEAVTSKAFAGMEDALVSFVTAGKLEVRSLVDSIAADLTRIAVRQTITGPLAAALSGAGQAGGGDTGSGLFAGVGSFLAGLFHEGGIAGKEARPARAVDALAFAAAPRFHTGGVAGLAPDEVPAILRRGEAVLTQGQMRALGTGLSSRAERQPPVTVVMNITTPDATGFRRSQGQIAAEAARAIQRARPDL